MVATAMGVPVAFTSVCASLSLEVMLITYLRPGSTSLNLLFGYSLNYSDLNLVGVLESDTCLWRKVVSCTRNRVGDRSVVVSG